MCEAKHKSMLALGKTTQSPAYSVINVHIYLEKKKGAWKVNVSNIFAVLY